MASFTAAALKVVVVTLVLAALGLPLLDTWRVLLLGAAALAVVFGVLRMDARRWLAAVALVAAIVGVRMMLPRADLAEAHNAFLVIGAGEPLQRGLPPLVFQNWKAQFDRLYPPQMPPYGPDSQWRIAGVPPTLYARSADAIWRHPKYSRQVDAIDFHTLGEFRGGFANDNQYNFYQGELLREQMPFYVMYELTAASVGSALRWTGQVFWERPDGGYEEMRHVAAAARTIGPGDIGRRVYAIFFPKRDPRWHFELVPSRRLRLAAWADAAFTAVAVVGLVVLLVRIRWRATARAVAIAGAAYAIMTAFLAVSLGKYLGRPYPPQGGGDDGLVHDGTGHVMALLAGDGRLVDALRGNESVYWFTPGTRYVRMAEKLVFGDTNHLFALTVCLAPIAVYYLLRHFAGRRGAWLGTALFLLLPVENPSFLQYLVNAKLGYGEAIGGALYCLGLAVLLRTQRGWGGDDDGYAAVTIGGAALAMAMFMRPNFAFAVVWLGCAYAWTCWQRGDRWRVAALAAGLGLALWMPFHNWYYGHEFYLISKSGATVSVPLAPRDYLRAVVDLLRGQYHSDAVTVTGAQITGWLSAASFILRPELRPVALAAHAVKLAALLWTGWIAVRWVSARRATETPLAIVAVAALCAHVPMLFVFATNYRYAMLGWDLSVIVLFVSVAGHRRLTASPTPAVAVAPVR